ncbi:hypothetical protein DCAR_0103370 [Daucus carota subsp. sativus]|uniref:Uncharacterized protein n=1 Tax=Daucus carota subsp. sativus TaxID=79200 RepID=A0A166HY60_DAUCS|nr:hypothetical protein DCAR_0103370 [Daucus carota subsp. sativus]
MSSPKDGDNMGKIGKGAPDQQPRAVGPYRGLVIRNDDFSIGLGAPVSSETCKENSLITPSPEMAPKPLAFAPAYNGATCPNGVPNVKDAASGEMNGSDIDLDLKL